MAKHFDTAAFETAIAGDKPVLVDFWATWCGPCRMIAPVIEEIAAEFEGKAVVGKVDVDEEPGLAQRYGIMSIPTLIVFKGGKVVEQAVGARGKADVAAMLSRHLSKAHMSQETPGGPGRLLRAPAKNVCEKHDRFCMFLFYCLTNCVIIENSYHEPIGACVSSEHLARRADGF